MSTAPPTSASAANRTLKRERDAPDALLDDESTAAVSPASSAAAGATTSNFRNVSACNRCRNRKNRCDQKLPRCTNCERANVKCVGFDPVSKREIPRSYVYYLETRVRNLEALLSANSIPCPAASEDFPIDESIKPGINVPFPVHDEDPSAQRHASKSSAEREPRPTVHPTSTLEQRSASQHETKPANPAMLPPVPTAPDRRAQRSSSGPSVSTSGISFARVVFAAVKRSVNTSRTSSPSGPRPSSASSSSMPKAPANASSSLSLDSAAAGGAAAAAALPGGSVASPAQMRDSFFGLHTRPGVPPAPFPDKALGARLAELYFEHANPQIPTLHRGEFGALFERVYGAEARGHRSSSSSSSSTPRELYLLNIVFAIGSGIIMDSSSSTSAATGDERPTASDPPSFTAGQHPQDSAELPNPKRPRLASRQHQPEEYHAAAMLHLESFLGSAPVMEGGGGGLEELQAVLLLAGLALLRPVAPGLWYIIGVAVRLSIDLGLHCEDIDRDLDDRAAHPDVGGTKSAGRRQWTRDLRRRLWWCVFNLDRLVSSCVGRPISISESVVTTEFPSLLDDTFITASGFLKAPSSTDTPSYKLVGRHYLRLRILQSEILQVLQHRHGDHARQLGANQTRQAFIPDLNSPYLQRFSSFREWRADLDRRLWQWKEEAPPQQDTGVAFTPLFYELNFWQAIIMLYRQSLAVPEPLANELTAATADDVHSPGSLGSELDEDKQMVLLKVAQAGQTVLKIYRQLHRLKLVNYTFLATHHLFMSGISFLYAVWGSTLVRSQLTIDDVDFTVLAAISVLSDLIEKCPPAEACRDAFIRMSKATISMVMKTTGFGNASTLGNQTLNERDGSYFPAQPTSAVPAPKQPPRRPVPRFDMNLRGLFSEEELAGRPLLAQPTLFKAPSIPLPQHSPTANAPVSPFSDPGTKASLPYQPPVIPTEKPLSPLRTAGMDWSDYANFDLDFLNEFAFPPDIGAGVAGGDAGNEPWDSSNVDIMLGQSNSFAGNTPFPSGASASGTGFDSSGAWEANGELFDTFFFGPAGSSSNMNAF